MGISPAPELYFLRQREDVGGMLIFALATLLQATTAPLSDPPADPAQQPPEASAPASTDQTSQTAQTPQNQREQRRCHREPTTGSRVPVLICTNQRVDDALASEAHNMVDRIQSQMPAQGN
jgi:hypothetical protein